MISPYEILEVSEDSTDVEIKKAYLVKVRKHPPERFPELFQQIRQAYELISTQQERLSYALFYRRLPDPVEIAELILKRSSKQKLPTGTEFKEALSKDVQKFCTDLEI